LRTQAEASAALAARDAQRLAGQIASLREEEVLAVASTPAALRSGGSTPKRRHSGAQLRKSLAWS
jgi:hypothetical protein